MFFDLRGFLRDLIADIRSGVRYLLYEDSEPEAPPRRRRPKVFTDPDGPRPAFRQPIYPDKRRDY